MREFDAASGCDAILLDLHGAMVAENSADGVEAAQATADRIAAQIWAERSQFVYDSEPLAASLERAKDMAVDASRPVLLLDHSDNCMSGWTPVPTDSSY